MVLNTYFVRTIAKFRVPLKLTPLVDRGPSTSDDAITLRKLNYCFRLFLFRLFKLFLTTARY